MDFTQMVRSSNERITDDTLSRYPRNMQGRMISVHLGTQVKTDNPTLFSLMYSKGTVSCV